MAYDFPSSPANGQVFAPITGPIWTYNTARGAWKRNAGVASSANKIVNPAMQISQQNGDNAGTTVNFYPADQWRPVWFLDNGTLSIVRATKTTPRGSKYRFRLTVTATETVTTSNWMYIRQDIEGNRLPDLGYGTVNSKYSVFRFGFCAPAGTYSCSISNSNGGASDWWVITFNFTVAAGEANTDKEYFFVVPPISSGAAASWPINNNAGVSIVFTLLYDDPTAFAPASGAWYNGQYNATASNTKTAITSGNVFELFDVGWYLDPNVTGVAPEFQALNLEDDLQDCLRYWYPGYRFDGVVNTGTNGYGWLSHYVPMRVSPNRTMVGSNVRCYDGTASLVVTSISNYNTHEGSGSLLFTATAGGLSPGRPFLVLVNASTINYIAVDARM